MIPPPQPPPPPTMNCDAFPADGGWKTVPCVERPRPETQRSGLETERFVMEEDHMVAVCSSSSTSGLLFSTTWAEKSAVGSVVFGVGGRPLC